jgi:hypothetical protein
LLLVALLAFGACHAQKSGFHWYKGNLHAHTLWSDGAMLPEVLIHWYSSHGYQFLGLSEHNLVADHEGWIVASEAKQRMGDGHACLHSDTCKPTSRIAEGVEQWRLKPLVELRNEFEHSGKFLLLENEEITNDLGPKRIHLTAVNISTSIPPAAEEDPALILDKCLHGIEADSLRQGVPAIGIVNHPNFTWAVDAESLARVRAARFLEIFNGHPYAASRGDTGKRSAVRVWDMANAERVLERGWLPLYGVAGDDTHVLRGAAEASPGRGWIVVRARRLRPADLVNAMLKGDFYASTGVSLDQCRFDEQHRRLSISVNAAPGVAYQVDFVATKHSAHPLDDVPAAVRWDIPNVGVLVKRVAGPIASYSLVADDAYVRATITASTNPSNPLKSNYTGDDSQLEQAFTQPVGWQRNRLLKESN